MLVDTHCHLDFEWFDGDRDAVLGRASEAGINRIIVPAISLGNCEAVLALAERYESVYAAIGVHPNSSADWRSDHLDSLRELAHHPKVVAIGEIGLDYYRDRSPRDVQRQALAEQLRLAAELDLPVILHNRQSDSDLVEVVRRSVITKTNRMPEGTVGVFHSFSGTWDLADQALSLGFYLGFTGPVTYKKADDLREIVRRTPLTRTLVETDAPFLAPQRHRGKRNEPAFVKLVAERVAEIHAIDLADFVRMSSDNAVRLFGQKLTVENGI